MQEYFISGRKALDDAVELVAEYGPDAPLAAAMRAVKSREVGNVHNFCHWRQIERFTELLASNNIQGTIH